MNNLKELFKSLFNGGSVSDLYARKSRWKFALAVVGMIIIVASTIYTNYLVGELRKQEEKRMDLYRQGIEIVGGVNDYNNLPQNIRDLIETVSLNDPTIPMILTDDHYNITDMRGFSDSMDSTGGFQNNRDSAFGKKRLDALIRTNREPIHVHDEDGLIISKIYYDDSKNLTLLRYYPLFQFILIGLFIGFGYLVFSSARRSEQNRVWVGMAKETAHQLGTPIAAILGWIQHLRSAHEADTETLEVVDELENDVSRLSLVADRFSKIGSEPELLETNIYEALDRCRTYMQKRSPRKVVFDFPKFDDDTSSRENRDFVPQQYLAVKINNHLFDWVVENLLRNALDAMEDGSGRIAATVSEDAHWVVVDISDTGKGIAASKFKTVFQPGFTTKKRGWGLGLSLAKRIIENYHGGKIFVKDSTVGKGTTFCIRLPKVL